MEQDWASKVLPRFPVEIELDEAMAKEAIRELRLELPELFE
jgi:hypothetical protein